MSQLAPAPLLPPPALAAGIACVAGAGALANCALLAAVLRRFRHGLYSIIIQLTIADIILLGTSIAPEIWSYNARTWNFGSNGCITFQGLNVFTSTSILYLIAAVALHSLATINLEEKAGGRRNKRSDQDDDEEIRSSRHSLVANSDSSTPPRTMNVDYRLADTKVPVTLPTVFVWVLAASLSVPEFALASTVRLDKEIFVCTLDSSHQFNMHSMLAVFILFLPICIMSTACTLIIVTLKSKKKPLDIDNCESVAALRLSMWHIIVYGVLCAPRSVLGAYKVYSEFMNEPASLNEKYQESEVITIISLAFSCTYLAATLVRPFLCFILLPNIRSVFSFGSRNTDNV